MPRGYTKEMRQAMGDANAPKMVVEFGRMYLTQRLPSGGEVKIDATGLYFFLKEMFTTDWQNLIPIEEGKTDAKRN